MVGPWTPPSAIHEPLAHWRVLVPADLDSLSFPHFSGPEFNALFSAAVGSGALANLAPVSALPAITGSAELDERIRVTATERGYRRRPLPADDSLLRPVDRGLPLQQSAAAAWLALQRDAGEQGFTLRLNSAYRGHDYQRQVFLRPIGAPYSLNQFAARLEFSAPPGYSKHHTGYAIDIGQVGYSQFGSSPAYEWMSNDNFAAAKKHGWIPSYPPDGGLQGPVPEPWEFTFVGVEEILCFHQPRGANDPLCDN